MFLGGWGLRKGVTLFDDVCKKYKHPTSNNQTPDNRFCSNTATSQQPTTTTPARIAIMPELRNAMSLFNGTRQTPQCKLGIPIHVLVTLTKCWNEYLERVGQTLQCCEKWLGQQIGVIHAVVLHMG
jgi:hypothetical protein